MTRAPSSSRESPLQPPQVPTLAAHQAPRLTPAAEGGSVLNLLRDSLDAIRSLHSVPLHGNAVFTLGSIGVEKAMKVMLGCDEIEAYGSWCSK